MGYTPGNNQKAELKRHLLSSELPETQKDLLKVDDDYLAHLNEAFDALDTLGYELDGKAGSKLFLLRQDEDGTFRRMPLDEAGIKPNTREFWKEAQMGSLFAYPSGGKEPIQIQAGKEDEDGMPEISCTKPVDAARLPSGRLTNKPNFFKRLMNRINKNWFKEVEFWNNQERSSAPIRAELEREAAARNEETLEQELKETADRELVKRAKARRDRAKISFQYSEAIFEPEPKIFATKETLEKYPPNKYPGRTVTDKIHDNLLHRKKGDATTFGFMSVENYGDLTQLGKNQLNLDSILLGDSGRAVSKSEFCSLAMFTTMSTDIVLNTHREDSSCRCDAYDPSALPGLLEAGYSQKEAEEIIASVGPSMFTTDTFQHPPRDSSGKFIKETIDIGRRRTADALNAYKNGDLEPLGRLLANGINKQAGSVAHEETCFGYEFGGGCESSRKLLSLMNADPRLRDAALKAGMEQKNLEVVEGISKLCELDEKACEANLKLAEANRDGVKLSTEKKQALVRDIVTAQLAFQLMKTENMNQKCPEMDRMNSLAGPALSGKQSKDMEYMKNNRPKGKLWLHTAYTMGEMMKGIYRKKPESIASIKSPTGFENLQRTASEIVAREKLAELEPGEIVKKMGMDERTYGEGLGEKGLKIMKEMGMMEPRVMETIRAELKAHATEKMNLEAQKTAENKQPEAQKTVENKQRGGKEPVVSHEATPTL